MYKLIGALIRKERLRKNYSQETLCKGICVVSYLSKIEKGIVKADDEIISQLFNALKIKFRMEEDLLKEKEKIYQIIDEGILYDKYKDNKSYIEKNGTSFSNSIIMIDFMLLELSTKMHKNIVDKDDIKEVIKFIDYMDEEQRYYANSLLGIYNLHDTKNLEKAKKYFYDARIYRNSSIPLYYYAICFYMGGEYLIAVDILYKVFSQAIEEGYLSVAVNACVQMAACYSNQHNMDLMMKYYRQALNLTNDEEMKDSIYYNCGASYLINKDYDEALKYLKLCEEIRGKKEENIIDNFYLYHKLAILYYELSDIDEAKRYLNMAKLSCKDEEFLETMIRLVEIRCENQDYIHDEEYGKAIRQVYENAEKKIHYGFKVFHTGYYIEYLKANRRYKEAVEVLESLNK